MILFDQFPRNMFRGHADQFATDHLALAIAGGAVDRGFDDQLEPQEHGFLYMPFQHSEACRPARSLLLFTALGDDCQLGFAQQAPRRHRPLRPLPHRNAMLGRSPRPDEIAAGDVVPW